MICTNLSPMVIIGIGLLTAWIMLITNNFRKQRQQKEALMLEEAIKEFEWLLAKESKGKIL